MFCNNENCGLKKVCFRFLPKHSKSKNLLIKGNSICLNHIEWTYSEEEKEKLEKVKVKANKFYDEHTTHIDIFTSSATVGYAPSEEDFLCPMLWKPEHWLWFLKRRNN